MTEIYNEIKEKEGDNFGKRCAICGNNERRLIEHHIVYYPVEEKIWVCSEECHQNAPQLQKRPIKNRRRDIMEKLKQTARWDGKRILGTAKISAGDKIVLINPVQEILKVKEGEIVVFYQEDDKIIIGRATLD